MKPILYSSVTQGTVPSDYGVGVLSDCISCQVKEKLNGVYELEMEYAAEGLHASEIVPNAVIKAKPNYTDAEQLFPTYKVGKTINGKFTVNAQHISYDLSGLLITSGTASSCGNACSLLQAQAGNFTITTDKSVSAPFKITEPSSIRSWFGGKQGSILDVYGPGEWKYDNFAAKFMTARGADRGVTIRYGKNLTELSQVLDMSNLVSAVLPYYKAQDGTITTGAKVSTGLVGVQRELAVDFSNDVDPDSATPITTQLATLTSSYIANNNFTTFKNTIKLNFVQLQGLTERVDLGDTVHIYFEPLGITATAKCVETVWDVLRERYTSITFGDPQTNIADTIVATQKTVAEIPSEIDYATSKITGNLGGYVVLHDSNGDGKPDEILIMDDPDISQAVKVWRWNQLGLGYSGTGYAGPFNKLALTDDGMIVADQIKTGVISDVAGNSTIDMTNGKAVMKDFDAKNIFRLLSTSGVTKAYITHNNGSGTTLMLLDEDGEQNAVLQSTADGGALHIKNKNGNDVVEAFSDSNTGGAYLWLSDALGINDCHIQLLDHARYPDIDIAVTSNGGRMDVKNGGYIYGSLRVYNSGGVLDLYDAQYLNIQATGSNGNITCVSLTQTSSRKVKENIKPMEDFKKILELDAVSFDFKNKNRGTNKRGFIAEDVAKVLPNLVTEETEKLPASLDYLGMIPYLQSVIKDQEKRIEALEKKVNGK